MSADKYAQFIAEQQRKLSVSGTNPVDLQEKKELSPKQKKIAAQAGDPDEIEGEDFEALRAKKHMKKEEVEEIDEKHMGFKKLEASIAKKGDVKDPAAVAAAIGRKKYGKEKFQKMAAAGKKGVKEEVEFTAEEMQQIDEAVKEGKIKDILDFHKDGMDHHMKMMKHHEKMANSCEDCGDSDGWHYHIDRAAGHLFDHENHKSKFDRVSGLASKAKKHADMKAAREVLDKGSMNP